MLALLLVFAQAPIELTPRRVEPAELESKVFRREWILPESLWKPADESRALPLALEKLLEQRRESSVSWARSFGDLVAEHRRRGATRAALDAMLRELEREDPSAHAEFAPLARQTLAADALRSPQWNPDVDRDDDGVFFGPLLERHAVADEPWRSHKGSSKLHQAATFLRADLEAITAALHDYRATFDDPGTNYEKLVPRADSFVTAESDELGPLAALRLAIRSDLPFPFTHYDCDLRVLHRLDSQSHLETYVFSDSSDFYWFAGRDVHLPVVTSAGEWQGTLLVRISGFDLRGVPDDDDNRKSGTRAALGNLRRRAEAAFEASGAVPRTTTGALPAFRVLAR